MRCRPFQAMWGDRLKGSVFMIIRQLKETQFEHLHNALIMKAHAEPLDASYTVNMTINGAEYAVKVQPEQHNKMAVLQALRISDKTAFFLLGEVVEAGDTDTIFSAPIDPRTADYVAGRFG